MSRPRDARDLDHVQIAVVDEADHMCDLGVLPVVRKLLSQVPAGGQRMLFSATLDSGVEALVREYLHGPVLIAVDPEVQPGASTAHHGFEAAYKKAKLGLVTALAGGGGRTLVFSPPNTDPPACPPACPGGHRSGAPAAGRARRPAGRQSGRRRAA